MDVLQRKVRDRRGFTVAVPWLQKELLMLSPQPQGQGLCSSFSGTYAMQHENKWDFPKRILPQIP